VRMLAIRGVEAVTARIDAVVAETRATLRERLAEIDPMIAAYRQANPAQ
jgi:hypothetical protein